MKLVSGPFQATFVHDKKGLTVACSSLDSRTCKHFQIIDTFPGEGNTRLSASEILSHHSSESSLRHTAVNISIVRCKVAEHTTDSFLVNKTQHSCVGNELTDDKIDTIAEKKDHESANTHLNLKSNNTAMSTWHKSVPNGRALTTNSTGATENRQETRRYSFFFVIGRRDEFVSDEESSSAKTEFSQSNEGHSLLLGLNVKPSDKRYLDGAITVYELVKSRDSEKDDFQIQSGPEDCCIQWGKTGLNETSPCPTLMLRACRESAANNDYRGQLARDERKEWVEHCYSLVFRTEPEKDLMLRSLGAMSSVMSDSSYYNLSKAVDKRLEVVVDSDVLPQEKCAQDTFSKRVPAGFKETKRCVLTGFVVRVRRVIENDSFSEPKYVVVSSNVPRKHTLRNKNGEQELDSDGEKKKKRKQVLTIPCLDPDDRVHTESGVTNLGEKSKNEGSTFSHNSEQDFHSVDYERAVADNMKPEVDFYFVRPAEQAILTQYMFLLIAQVKRGVLTVKDLAKANRRKNEELRVGYLGMRCRHCGGNDRGNYFPTSCKNLQACPPMICTHLMKCAACPSRVKNALKRLKLRHKGQVMKMKTGQQVDFFFTLWDRIRSPCYDGGGHDSTKETAKNIKDLIHDDGGLIVEEGVESEPDLSRFQWGQKKTVMVSDSERSVPSLSLENGGGAENNIASCDEKLNRRSQLFSSHKKADRYPLVDTTGFPAPYLGDLMMDDDFNLVLEVLQEAQLTDAFLNPGNQHVAENTLTQTENNDICQKASFVHGMSHQSSHFPNDLGKYRHPADISAFEYPTNSFLENETSFPLHRSNSTLMCLNTIKNHISPINTGSEHVIKTDHPLFHNAPRQCSTMRCKNDWEKFRRLSVHADVAHPKSIKRRIGELQNTDVQKRVDCNEYRSSLHGKASECNSEQLAEHARLQKSASVEVIARKEDVNDTLTDCGIYHKLKKPWEGDVTDQAHEHFKNKDFQSIVKSSLNKNSGFATVTCSADVSLQNISIVNAFSNNDAIIGTNDASGNYFTAHSHQNILLSPVKVKKTKKAPPTLPVSVLNNVHKPFHARKSSSKIFTNEDDVLLAKGVLKHGKRWRVIWEEFDGLQHIKHCSLKDRARSLRFQNLLKRAQLDPTILDDPSALYDFRVNDHTPENAVSQSSPSFEINSILQMTAPSSAIVEEMFLNYPSPPFHPVGTLSSNPDSLQIFALGLNHRTLHKTPEPLCGIDSITFPYVSTPDSIRDFAFV